MSQGDAPGSDLPLIHSPSDRDCLKNLARNELQLYELLKIGKEALFSASGTSQPYSPDSLYLLFRQSRIRHSRKSRIRAYNPKLTHLNITRRFVKEDKGIFTWAYVSYIIGQRRAAILRKVE